MNFTMGFWTITLGCVAFFGGPLVAFLVGYDAGQCRAIRNVRDMNTGAVTQHTMSAVWGRVGFKKMLSKLFWLIAAIFFGGVIGSAAQTKDGEWSVHIVRSPMGDRSFAVASSEAASMFNGARPKLVIACEVTRDGNSHGATNIFVDLGAPLMLAQHFKDRNKSLPINTKIDDAQRISDRWHQSETFRELFHDADTEADQRAFVRWMSESKRVMVELAMGEPNDVKVFGFTTTGLKPYVPVLAQACGWHK